MVSFRVIHSPDSCLNVLFETTIVQGNPNGIRDKLGGEEVEEGGRTCKEMRWECRYIAPDMALMISGHARGELVGEWRVSPRIGAGR